MVSEEELKEAFDRTIASDYVRCRSCDEKRLREGSDEELCHPHNAPADLLCPCGAIREPYECQSGEWITDGRVNSDPMARVVPDLEAPAVRAFWRDVNPRDVVVIGGKSESRVVHAEDVVVPGRKTGHRGDVIIYDMMAPEVEVLVIESPPLAAYEPFTPPRAGSKGYQRRQNQRWPKGR